MAWLEKRAGCGDMPHCFGPTDEYWTLLGAQLGLQIVHVVLALVAAALVLLYMTLRRRRGTLRMHPAAAVALTLAVFVAVFVLLVVTVPVTVDY